MIGRLNRRLPAGSRRSVYHQLVLLVLTCVLPVWLVGGFLVCYAYQSKRQLIQQNLLETAHTLRQTVDVELASAQSAMKVLATSPALNSGDLAAFDRQAREVAAEYPGADIIMADATGQQVVNTHLPYGAPLPFRGAADTVQRIFQTGRPAISDLFLGSVSKRHVISVDVPVIRNGNVIYDLALTFPSSYLDPVLGRGILPDHWFRTIYDSKNIVVARSHKADQFVGQNGPVAVSEGLTEHVNLENIRVIVAFSRFAETGWLVAVGVPKDVLLADLRRWLWWTTGGAAALSVMGLAFAVVMGQRIAGAHKTLVGSAQALGRGEAVTVAPLHVKEADEVAAALAQASELLAQHSVQRDQAERGYREAKAEAEAANVSKSKFLAAASHDLRQPLQALGLFLTVLAGRIGKDEAVLMANLEHCHANLNEMLSDMLDISKLDAGVVTPQVVEFPLGELLERVAASHQLPAQGKGLFVHLVRTGAVIRSDPALLQRVLSNFLSNAVRYTERGGVLIGCRRRGGRRWIEVWDTGIGIPANMIDEIFDEFRQLDNPARNREKGSGLGLAIVRKTAGLLGLEIRVSSVLGKGSVFALELPAA